MRTLRAGSGYSRITPFKRLTHLAGGWEASPGRIRNGWRTFCSRSRTAHSVGPESFDIALLLCALMLPRKVHPIRAAIVIALFVMMCQHWRFGVVFDIITLLILATPFAKPIEQKRALDWRRSARVAILAVGLVGVTFGAESLTWPVVRGDGLVLVGSPVDGPANWALVYAELEAGLDAVPVALRSHRVANRWDYGPYLIFRGVKVMRDDRFELYGKSL
jgi:hypothetical protein